VRVPAQHGKCSMLGRSFPLFEHTVCVLFPTLPHHDFPSIQGIISLLIYQTLLIILDGSGNQNFKFFPRSEKSDSNA
jgi:hypothetical protein